MPNPGLSVCMDTARSLVALRKGLRYSAHYHNKINKKEYSPSSAVLDVFRGVLSVCLSACLGANLRVT